MKQLAPEAKTTISANIRKRINAGLLSIEKIKSASSGKMVLTDQDQKDIAYIQKRIAELQISYRIVFNTGWVWHRRTENIQAYTDKIKETDNKAEQDRYILNRTLLQKSLKCTKCFNRGYIGFNETKGEFSLCTCTQKILNLH